VTFSIEVNPPCSSGRESPKRKSTPRIWQGWKDTIAHPQAPDGGGGPGFFRQPHVLGGEDSRNSLSGFDHPDAPQPLNESDNLKFTSKKKNKAPQTKVISKTSIKGLKKSTDQIEVDISYQVLADKKDSQKFAITDFTIPEGKFSTHDPAKGVIGKFTWKGTVTIQTIYSDPVKNREGVSCYGRGTTKADLDKGDITIGFHESCHRKDFVQFLTDPKHTRPKIPNLTKTMTKSEYNKATEKFKVQFKNYFAAMRKFSETRTDEVGKKKSKVKTDDDCFVHILPPENK